jgi:hypothetical protein
MARGSKHRLDRVAIQASSSDLSPKLGSRVVRAAGTAVRPRFQARVIHIGRG